MTNALALVLAVASGFAAGGGVAPVAAPATGAAVTDGAVAAAAPIVVALDPGHGGTNLGAAGPAPGSSEKHVTLALATRIRDLLAPLPAVKVVLCRQSDMLVPIRARVRCARDAGARMFISLHANASPPGTPAGVQHGFEVYLLGPREVEDDAALAALGEADDADAALAAHEVRAAAERSVRLARLVDARLAGALGAEARRGIRQSGAALDVLRGTDAAAVLIEAGFLDHADEGARLATPAGREPIARAIADAITDYARAEAGGGVPAAAGRGGAVAGRAPRR